MTRSSGSGRRGLLVAAAAAAFAAVVGGVVACGGPSTDAPAGPTSSAASAPPAPALTAPAAPTRGVAPLASSRPERVQVASIGVDSDLMALGLNSDHTVEVPPLERPEQAGWYRYAPTPGAAGPAVILGHIDGGGRQGVFYRLQEMKAGQQIVVSRADGQNAIFTVTEVRRFPKDAFPTQRVYGETPDAQLRLISCGGALDRSAHSYVDNVVVFATLTGTSKA